MEKRSDEYWQFEQFGPANAQKPQKKQYHEVIGFPANSDQPQPYVPTYQWLPRSGVAQMPNQQPGYVPTNRQQSQAQATVSQKPFQQQSYAPTQQRFAQARAIERPDQQQSYAPTQQRVPPAGMTQKSKGPKPMPKARALDLVNSLKKSLVVVSLAAFVSFGGLAAFHQVGTTASKTASATSTSSKSTTSSQSSSKNTLKQTGGSNIGTSSTGSSSSSTSGTSSGTSNTGGSSSSTSGTSGSSSSSSSSAVSGSSVS